MILLTSTVSPVPAFLNGSCGPIPFVRPNSFSIRVFCFWGMGLPSEDVVPSRICFHFLILSPSYLNAVFSFIHFSNSAFATPSFLLLAFYHLLSFYFISWFHSLCFIHFFSFSITCYPSPFAVHLVYVFSLV